MKILVTGGAGFIGSYLVRKLAKNNNIVVLDNLSSGKKEFLPDGITFHDTDLSEDDIEKYFVGVDEVWHLAANPDVRTGEHNPTIHTKQNTIATQRILESMRNHNVNKLVFASTSTVYGDIKVPTIETDQTMPISTYGASKLACEALISSYCHTFSMQSWMFRFANVVGYRGHGVIQDLINKLVKNSRELEILGDGEQKKSYIYVDDCVDAMITARKTSNERVNIFNIGSGDWITVKDIANIICKKMKLAPKFKFTGGSRGWRGDIPKMLLDIKKIKKTGWRPKYNSQQAVTKAAENILKQASTI